MVVDLGGVETGDGNGGKQRREKTGTYTGQFVEDERAPGGLGKDRQQPGAGRRLQHTIGRGDGGCRRRSQPKRDGGRELLEGLRLF